RADYRKPARLNVEARAPIRAHALELVVQPRTEVDIRCAALEAVDLVEELEACRQAGIRALIARECLERDFIGMHGDDGVEQKLQLVLILIDVVEILEACPMEGPQAGVAGFVEFAEARFQFLHAGSRLLAL